MSEPQTPLEQLVSESPRPENRVRSWLSRNATSDKTIALFTVVIAAVGYFQWRAIHDQWKEMHDAGHQTDTLIGLYQQQLAALQKQANDTHDLAVQAGKQAEAAKVIATAARNMFAANRPEVVVLSAAAKQSDDLKRLHYQLLVENDGPVAARHMVIRCDAYIDDKKVEPDTLDQPAVKMTLGSEDSMKICGGSLGLASLEKVQSHAVFTLKVYATYNGPAGHYKYCDTQKYLPQLNIFTDAGECDSSKLFPKSR